MDAAKVLAAANGDFARVRHFLETGQDGDALGARRSSRSRPRPARAARSPAGRPSGTPSGMKKYSLAPRALYPEVALVDPLLTTGLPRGITISTGLDALRHALESIWNVNANPVSAALAETAAREIIEALPLPALDLRNDALRTRHGTRQPVRGPRLLQHQDRAGARPLLPSTLAFRHAARHRLLLQPADGDAQRHRLRPGLRREPAPHLRQRPRRRRRAPRGSAARRSASRRAPPTTASRPPTGRA